MLRSQSNDVAVRVTAKTMESDEREERLLSNSATVELARERLDRMRQCLLMQSNSNVDGGSYNSEDRTRIDEGRQYQGVGGGLKDALVSGTQQIQALRFHYACKVFDMHRLDVGEQYSKQVTNPKESDKSTAKGNESATGVGKIGGLPLPHAGPVLYGVIPPFVLASSLRLVASLTQLVARCLGVVLPHPILVCVRECRCGSVYDFGGDVIDVANNDYDGCDDDEEYPGNSEHGLCSACRHDGLSETKTTTERPQQTKSLSSSSSAQSQRKLSLLSLVGSSARKAIAITTSATSRAITNMQHSSTAGGAVPSGHLPSKSSTQNTHATTSNEAAMSSGCISRRINHASFAYLRENYDKSATEYVLNPPRWREEGNHMSKTEASTSINNADSNKVQTELNHGTQAQTFSNREEFHVAEERFATGMQLLQNDVVALCFRAGVDVSALWPAESVLLNLHSLWCHCQKMAEATSQQSN